MKAQVGFVLLTFLLAEALGFRVQFTNPDGISYHKNALYKVQVSTPLEAVNLRRIQRLFNHMESDEEFDPHTRVDVWPDHEVRKGHNLIRVPPTIVEEFENILDKNGFQYELVLKNLQEAIDDEAQNNILRDDSDFFSTYRTYEDFQEFMKGIAEAYPSIAQLFYVGTTHEGRNITGVRVSGPNAVSKPGFMFIGGQHAREWIAPATVAFILNTLVTEYGQNADVTSIVDGVEFFIVPLANPDGYVYTQSDRMWRKNRNKDRTSACYGVDNNRNWAYEWNTGGSSGLTCSETYHGTAAFSEKENIGLSNFVSNHSNIEAFIDFHSYGQLFMNPWGYTYDLSPDNTLQQQVSTAGEKAIQAVHGTKYEVGTDTQLTYIASGGSDDWVYGARGAVYSYTIELRDTGKYGFLLPADQIVPQGQEAFAGVQYIAQYLLGL